MPPFSGSENWSQENRGSCRVRNNGAVQGRATWHRWSRTASPFRLLPELGRTSRILVTHGRALSRIAKYPRPLKTFEPLRAIGSHAPRRSRKASPWRKQAYGLPPGRSNGHTPGGRSRCSALCSRCQLASSPRTLRGKFPASIGISAIPARCCPWLGSLPPPRTPVYGPKGQGIGASGTWKSKRGKERGASSI